MRRERERERDRAFSGSSHVSSQIFDAYSPWNALKLDDTLSGATVTQLHGSWAIWWRLENPFGI